MYKIGNHKNIRSQEKGSRGTVERIVEPLGDRVILLSVDRPVIYLPQFDVFRWMEKGTRKVGQ